MTATVVLLGYALLIATGGAGLLRRSGWTDRSPRLGVLAWQALTASVLGAIILAGVVLAVPVWSVSVGLGGLLETCAMLVSNQYATVGGAAASTTGLAAAALVLVRVGHSMTRALLAARAGRRRQRDAVALVARRHHQLDALVVEHGSCAAYCIPGLHGEVVLTSATVASLNSEQLSAVLAHERAHLRSRHDLVLALATGLRMAFPFIPAFAQARVEVSRLLEMVADDAAATTHDRTTVATALIRLADGAAPAGTLAAGGDTALARVRRLSAPVRPLSRMWTALTVGGLVVLAITPLLLAAAPAIAVSSAGYCPVTFSA